MAPSYPSSRKGLWQRITRLSLVLLWLWIPETGLSSDDTDSTDIYFSKYMRESRKRIPWDSPSQNEGLSTRMEQAQLVLNDPLQTEENIYYAASYFSEYLILQVEVEQLHSLCSRVPPKSDDYTYRYACIVGTDLPLHEKVANLQKVADEAYQAWPQKMLGAYGYQAAANVYYFSSRTHAQIQMLRKVFEKIPTGQTEPIMEQKVSLALALTNPMLSLDLQKQAIQLYSEARAWYDAQPDSPHYDLQSALISYNKAISHLLLFKEYEKAIADFQLASGADDMRLDRMVFTAYSHARLGNIASADAILKGLDFAENTLTTPSRTAFLKCYTDLTHYLLGRQRPLDRCLDLEDPQTDILFDLTGVLSSLGLPPGQENKMWRTFYRYFSRHLLPDIQRAVESATAQAELESEKAESRLKDLKLQNLKLYKNLSMSLIGTAAFFALALLITLRSWRTNRQYAKAMAHEHQRLQHILDNIEEGIIIIHSDLSLEQEESSHLRSILGEQELDSQELISLLKLFEMNDDQRDIALACVRACMGESLLAWDLNASNFPAATQIKGQDIALYWQPSLEDDVIRKIFLVMRDVTAIRQLERASSAAQAEADRQLHYGREILSGHTQANRAFISQLPRQMEELVQMLEDSRTRAGALRMAHTIKGTARSLGLKALQEEMHHLESALVAEDNSQTRASLEQLLLVVQSYHSALQSIFGLDQQQTSRSLLEIVAELRSGLQAQLDGAHIAIDQLLVNEEAPLDPEAALPVRNIILHSLSNAADHGYIRPLQRGERITSARFEISYMKRGDSCILQIRDNGLGLNHGKIRELALEKGWKPEGDQDWSAVLFLDGVSTASDVTQTSGRGVGLAAVKEASEKLGGQVRLLDNEKARGTLVEVTWKTSRRAAA